MLSQKYHLDLFSMVQDSIAMFGLGRVRPPQWCATRAHGWLARDLIALCRFHIPRESTDSQILWELWGSGGSTSHQRRINNGFSMATSNGRAQGGLEHRRRARSPLNGALTVRLCRSLVALLFTYHKNPSICTREPSGGTSYTVIRTSQKGGGEVKFVAGEAS